MNKIKWFIIVGFSLLFTACVDDTTDFVRPYFTNGEYENAYKSCLTVSFDTAATNLFTEDGFYSDLGVSPIISFPQAVSFIADTLALHQQSYLIDSLVLSMNRASESSNTTSNTYFKIYISKIVFANPSSLLWGDADAVTNAFKNDYLQYLRRDMLPSVQTQLTAFNVQTHWNNVLSAYYQYNSQPIGFDLNNYILTSMLDAIFKEMATEESLIRRDSTHRVNDYLQEVFGVLDLED